MDEQYPPPTTSPLGVAWYITGACNYACPYCYDRQKPRGHPPLEMADVGRVFGYFVELRGDVRVALTGGEPTVHPQFGELLRFLSAHCSEVRISTNLSRGAGPILDALAHPERCSVNASFHPDCAEIEPFGRSVADLMAAGVGVFPSYVLYPPNAPCLPEYRDRLADIAPRATLGGLGYVGEYAGRRYPEPADTAGAPDAAWRPPGMLCRAGQDYVAILADRRVVRCVQGVPLFEDRWPQVILSHRPLPCGAPSCDCPDMRELWLQETGPPSPE